MKKLLALLGLLFLAALLVIGGGLLLSDSPAKDLESFAMRHADKLPLAYLGEKLFDKHCSSCHDNPAMHAPSREALSGFSKETVMVALEFGKMQPMAAHLSKTERGLIAIYLSGSDSDAFDWITANSCQAPVGPDSTPYVSNWGQGDGNRRFVGAARSNIHRDNVDSLELAWALAFPKVTDMRSQPAIIGDTLYFGDKTGRLYAIDRTRGCLLAHTKVASGIRSAITAIDDDTLVFADSMAVVYADDRHSHDIQWLADMRLFSTSTITGSISYHDERLFTPLCSL